MNILIDVIHPAHVHFFRNAIGVFRERGHNVAVTAREKDVTIELLENYGIEFTILSKVGSGLLGLGKELLIRDWRLWRFCRSFRPDVLTGISGMFCAHVGLLMRKPSVVWDDTEHQKKAHAITYPFATEYHSPDCYMKSLGRKQHLYAGCHELAYLHPKRFTPDADVVRSLGIDPQSRYCILRLVSWGAHHDVGQHGLDAGRRLEFIKAIAEHARPYVSSEGPLPLELEPYRLKMPVHQVHHVMAFASLCVSEGATMVTESSLLGVPAVYVNTLKAGTINMLQSCGLVDQTTDTDEALNYCVARLADPDAKEKAAGAREKLLAEKIDVTAHIVETVERAAERKRRNV